MTDASEMPLDISGFCRLLFCCHSTTCDTNFERCVSDSRFPCYWIQVEDKLFLNNYSASISNDALPS